MGRSIKGNNTLIMQDGTPILYGKFEPQEKPKGVFQIVHGFGEHIDLYDEVIEYFLKHNFACVIHDQRGFGKMPDKRKEEHKSSQGIIKDYDDFLRDINEIRDKIDLWYPNTDVFLYGHSMGGNIVINYLLKYGQDRYKKAILETPWLRLYEPKPKMLVLVAKFLGKMNHKLAIVNELNVGNITRDTESQNKIENNDYYHNRISYRLFSSVTDRGEYAICNASKISIPTLLLCAEEDKIVCPKAIKEFKDNGKENIILESYEDGFHSLHSDTISEEVLCRIVSFCKLGDEELKADCL